MVSTPRQFCRSRRTPPHRTGDTGNARLPQPQQRADPELELELLGRRQRRPGVAAHQDVGQLRCRRYRPAAGPRGGDLRRVCARIMGWFWSSWMITRTSPPSTPKLAATVSQPLIRPDRLARLPPPAASPLAECAPGPFLSPARTPPFKRRLMGHYTKSSPLRYSAPLVGGASERQAESFRRAGILGIARRIRRDRRRG